MSPLAAGSVLEALKEFACEATRKSKLPVAGDPEDQLREPIETFMRAASSALCRTSVTKGELRAGALGRPDFGMLARRSVRSSFLI